MLTVRQAAFYPLITKAYQFGARKKLHVLTSAACRVDCGGGSKDTVGSSSIFRCCRRSMSGEVTSFDPAANLPPRSESDSMGSLPIAAGTFWGCQTQRSLGNFKIGGVESKSKFFEAFCSFCFTGLAF